MPFAGRPRPTWRRRGGSCLPGRIRSFRSGAELFRADVAMVGARVAAPGPSGKYSWRRLVLRAGATYTGLRLLDGALVLKVRQGRDTGQLRVVDGAAFDPALNGLETAMRRVARARRGWVLMESLDGIVSRR